MFMKLGARTLWAEWAIRAVGTDVVKHFAARGLGSADAFARRYFVDAGLNRAVGEVLQAGTNYLR